MAEKVGKEQTKREKGYLYYLGKDGYLWKTPTKPFLSRKYMYPSARTIFSVPTRAFFPDLFSFVSRAKMKNA